MDAEREREIRALASRLLASKRHHRIGLVLGDLLCEIELLRQDELPSDFDPREAMALIARYADARPAKKRDKSQQWRANTLKKAHLYDPSV